MTWYKLGQHWHKYFKSHTLKSHDFAVVGNSNICWGTPWGKALHLLERLLVVLCDSVYMSSSCWMKGMASHWKVKLWRIRRQLALDSIIMTHRSSVLVGLYHRFWSPISNISSKPLDHISLSRAHSRSGLMFLCPCIQLCCKVPDNLSSSCWRIEVWA